MIFEILAAAIGWAITGDVEFEGLLLLYEALGFVGFILFLWLLSFLGLLSSGDRRRGRSRGSGGYGGDGSWDNGGWGDGGGGDLVERRQ